MSLCHVHHVPINRSIQDTVFVKEHSLSCIYFPQKYTLLPFVCPVVGLSKESLVLTQHSCLPEEAELKRSSCSCCVFEGPSEARSLHSLPLQILKKLTNQHRLIREST
jgi:hypothetical protein